LSHWESQTGFDLEEKKKGRAEKKDDRLEKECKVRRPANGSRDVQEERGVIPIADQPNHGKMKDQRSL